MRSMERSPARQADLGDVVLDCFCRAYSEGRLDVAEHLLVAIEQLSKDEAAGHPEHHGHVADAYRVIADQAKPAESSGRRCVSSKRRS